jgi:hypothetical protein
MGIEFIRSRSKDHHKAWAREAELAAADLFTGANAPVFVTRVLLARATTAMEKLAPETVLLLKAEGGGQVDCYLKDERVATVEGPTAMQLVSEMIDRPHKYFAAVIEERHTEAGQIHVRILE